jgi:maleylacetate reductase
LEDKGFTYDALPGRVVFGAGCARRALAPELERLGARRALLIAAEPERALAEELAAGAADRVARGFYDVRPHVPVEIAEQARAAARDAGADVLLSIGGGSTTGTAKAVALELGLPILAVPTTYAGSEMTPVWGLTEGGRKTTGRDDAVLPRTVLYDPELTLTLPVGIAVPSAINALAHCVEAFYGPTASPITSLLAEEGIRALAAGVSALTSDPAALSARTETLYGAYLAGAGFAAAGSGLHHKICHVLGGAYDLPHAQTHAIVLPHVLAYNEPAMGEDATRIARALGAESGAAAALGALLERVGAPTALRDVGLAESRLEEAVGLLLEADLPERPRRADERALNTILRGAYAGRLSAQPA